MVSGLQLGLGCSTTEGKKRHFVPSAHQIKVKWITTPKELSFIKMKHQMDSHHGIKVLNALTWINYLIITGSAKTKDLLKEKEKIPQLLNDEECRKNRLRHKA